HTEDPQKVIENAKSAGSVIRIFEWINTVKNEMHPHVLTKEQLDQWLGCNGTVGHVPDGDSEFYSAVVPIPERNATGYTEHTDLIGLPGTPGPPRIEPHSPNVKHRPKRFHLLCLPHVAANKQEGLACAFSQKVVKMGQMLKSLGHTVFCYGVEGSEVECDEFIEVSTQEVLQKCYGDYDMKAVTYKHAFGDLAYQVFNHHATVAIKERMQPDDFLLVPFSPSQYKEILDALETTDVDSTDRLHLTLEMGIGYRGTRCRYKVFESISQMHLNYGLANAQNNGASLNGNWYDAVIPNYFDPDDFEYSDSKKDYFLYLGRVTSRKGVSDAIKTVETVGAKLIVAGQIGDGRVDLSSPNVEFVGFADVEKRRELLRDAKGLFLPTWYIEPFGGVIIEANMSGTPVITSPWGAFAELMSYP
ncbi:MAG: glycosyltransferase, partial [Candidatus Thorarchaeota archaeon]